MAKPTLASTLPGILAAAAFITSMFATLQCKFLSFTSQGNNPFTLYFGIWYYQGWSIVQTNLQGTVVLETCYNYPEEANVDPQWRSARAFSTLALIIGGLATIWALLTGCSLVGRKAFEVGGGVYLLCCLFQGLSLLLLDSDVCNDNDLLATVHLPNSDPYAFPSHCAMAAGAKCAIASTVLWFLAAGAALLADPEDEDPAVTYTRPLLEEAA